MPMAEGNKKKIKKLLLHKYRLIILNEDTFVERFSFKLSRLNVFVLVCVSAIVMVFLTTVLIAFTPLREYIPGYAAPKVTHKAVDLLYKTDSLEQVIDNQNRYFSSIQRTLKGDTLAIDDNEVEDEITENNVDDVDMVPSRTDSLLRLEVEKQEKYNVFNPSAEKSNIKFFSPVKGHITEPYNLKIRHYGIDISTSENQPVKATADGTVIFAEWTTETGYVLVLEHSFGWISVYKHNSSLAKSQGDRVKGGEVIAMTGNTGDFTTGPHLHFELWRDDYSVDPSEFMEFE